MSKLLRNFLGMVFGVVGFGLCGSGAWAQSTFPTRPVTITISVSPGGGVDTTTREIAKVLSEQWGQTVLIDNKPGAGGIIAATVVIKSAPDGHNLFLAHTGDISSTPHLFARTDYQPLKQLTPISQVLSQPYVAIVHPSNPAKTTSELVAQIKAANAAGNKYSYATGQLGAPEHLAGEQFALSAGLSMVPVPYKSAAPAIADVLGGHVPFGFFSLAAATPHVKAGSVRMIAITSNKRSELWPDLPTVMETLPGYLASAWYGVFGPVGMSPELVNSINRDVHAAVNSPSMKKLMHDNGQTAALSTPSEFAEFLRVDSARTAEYIQKANIKLQ